MARRHPVLGIAMILAMGWLFAVHDTSVRWLGATLRWTALVTAWLNLRGAERERRAPDPVAADTIAD